MNVNEKILNQVIERILAVSKPRKVILFGSAASGDMTRDSDLDLLVIEEDFMTQREESTRLRAALVDLGLPVDVFPMTPERFEETKDIIGGLAYPAHKYGRVIYEAA
jgi:predicted nucleotidyltransferase